MPLTGNVAWARKFGSENMSSSLTTKRRKVSSGSCTGKVIGSAFHAGLRPLSPAAGGRTELPVTHIISINDFTGTPLLCLLRWTMVLNFSSVYPLSSTSTNGLAMLRESLGRCRAARTCGGQTVGGRTPCSSESLTSLYLDNQVILDALLFLLRVVVVLAHELWLQHVTRASVQTEEGAVQLGVFI